MAYYDPLWLQANVTIVYGSYSFTIDQYASSDTLWVYRCPTQLGDADVGLQTVHCTLQPNDTPIRFHISPDEGSWRGAHWYYTDGEYTNEDIRLPGAERAALDNWLLVTINDLHAMASAFYFAIRSVCG